MCISVLSSSVSSLLWRDPGSRQRTDNPPAKQCLRVSVPPPGCEHVWRGQEEQSTRTPPWRGHAHDPSLYPCPVTRLSHGPDHRLERALEGALRGLPGTGPAGPGSRCRLGPEGCILRGHDPQHPAGGGDGSRLYGPAPLRYGAGHGCR